MAKKKAVKVASEIVKLPIPRGTISKIKLGQSFAEYDCILTKPNVFVETHQGSCSVSAAPIFEMPQDLLFEATGDWNSSWRFTPLSP